MHTTGTELTHLAGYRLVRTLGSGTRSEVFLGAGATGSVALKLYRDETDEAEIFRELEVLGRLPAEHCVRLLDVATAPSGVPLPILERVHRGSLTQLLTSRRSLEAGEAVTLLAPIAATVARLYRSGVVHGRISPGSIHLGAAGEPVLLGFGHSSLVPAPASVAVIESSREVAKDFGEVLALATSVLGLVDDRNRGSGRSALLEWVSATATTVGTVGYRVEFATALEARLFELADPLPVTFGQLQLRDSGIPARAVIPIAPSASFEDAIATTPEQLRPRVRGGVAGRLLGAVAQSPIEHLRARVADALRGVRKPVWVVAGGIVAALVLALALIPQGNAAAEATVTRTPLPAPTTSGEPIRSADPLPAEPVAALTVLLRERTACIRDRSVTCLSNVDEASSSALAADSTLVGSIEAGGQVTASATLTANQPRLVEVLGDSALVALGANSNPASALMIKGGAGWRIRDFLSGKAQGSQADAP